MYEQQFNPYAANLAVVKGYFKRGKVLAMGVLYIISALLTVGTFILMTVFGQEIFNDLFSVTSKMNGYPALDSNTINQMTSMGSASTILGIIPIVIVLAVNILIGAAFIAMCTGSRKENGSPKAGVTIMYVLSMIGMILVSIYAGFAVLMTVMFAFVIGFAPSGFSDYYFTINGQPVSLNMEAFTVLFIIMAVIIVCVIIYLLLYTIHKFRFYSSVRKSITTVELQNKGAKAFGVMSVINAVFSGFSLVYAFLLIAAVVSLGLSGYMLIIAACYLLFAIIQLIMYILDASIALGYKKYIDEMKYGYNGTPYGGITEGNYAPAPEAVNPYAVPYQQQDNFGAQQNPYVPYGAPAQPSEPTSYPSAEQQPANGYTDISGAEPIAPTEPISQPEPAHGPAFCTNCGASVAPGSAFCTNCGKRLN